MHSHEARNAMKGLRWWGTDELFFWVFIVLTFAVVFLVLWLRWAY